LLLVIGQYAMAVPAAGQVTREKLDETLGELKEAMIELEEIRLEFQVCEESGQYELRERFLEVRARGKELRRKAIDQAAVLHGSSEEVQNDLLEMLAGLPVALYESHEYALAARVGKALMRHDPGNSQLIFSALRSAFFSNQFDLAAELVDEWNKIHGSPPEELRAMVNALPAYRQAWDRELQRRAADSGAPRPQLEFETEAGTFVVELFEDEFPQITENLIALVEQQDLFRDTPFFEVFEHLTVRGAAAQQLGRVDLPPHPDQRGWHFQGTFSMFVVPGDNMVTAGFSIQRIPVPILDGRNLVIGHVIEGMDVVNAIQTTHEFDDSLQPVPLKDVTPSRIIDVRVLRKRDHEYQYSLESDPAATDDP
jgi:cyclophilin family peptidyl-prolyl cis-trans isomerase